jgi:hypothetical protein
VSEKEFTVDSYFHLWYPSEDVHSILNSDSRITAKPITKISEQELVEFYNPIDYLYEEQLTFDPTIYPLENFDVYTKPERVLSMLCSMMRSVSLVDSADLVVLKRTDCIVEKAINLDQLEAGNLYVATDMGELTARPQYTTNEIFVDYMTVGDMRTIKSYSSAFINMHKRNRCSWVPEYIIADHVADSGLQIVRYDFGKLTIVR